jgi:glutamyl-tRNA synthetase, bacterial family
MDNRRVRVRFAPSPTGPLHIGGVRTALFNYLFARKHGGDFLLRIEDTDSNRFVPGAEAYIVEALKWCGIEIDEGVSVGGPHEPYRQSERRAIYKKYADQLVASGNAYYAFDTPEELDALRLRYETEGKTFTYNYEIRNTLSTSIVLSAEEVKRRIDAGDGWVIRFKMPVNEEVEMFDLIRDRVVVNTSTLDDKVLFKSADMLPTYHLANVVDDYLMEISHVIRGEEWLPSLPLHVLLYRSFGWTDVMPMFAHLPLLLKPTGNGKLSKRDGDKLGFPVFPLFWKAENGDTARGYREDGYFPEAFVNLLALLGWNSGTEQELFSMQELINLFSLERVNKSGARFDPEKAKWFNQQYLRMKSDAELTMLFMPILAEEGVKPDHVFVEKVIALVKERAMFVKDLWSISSYFFIAPKTYDEKVVKKFWKGNVPFFMEEAKQLLSSVEIFNTEVVEKVLHDWISEKQLPMGPVMNNLRLCLVGASMGPGVAQIASLIGKQETISRIDAALKSIKIEA